MSFNKTGKIFMVLAIVAVLGIAVTSFADWGRGHWGYGSHMGSGSAPDPRSVPPGAALSSVTL